MKYLVYITLSLLVFMTGCNASSTDKFENMKEKVIAFEKTMIDPRLSIEKMEVIHEVDVEKGWRAYIVDIEVSIQGQTKAAKDIVYSDGVVVARDIKNLKTGDSYESKLEEFLYPKISDEYHNKQNLIIGSHDAKNKVIVFSDPLCPYCVKFAPAAMEKVKNAKDVAMYYYHYPLPMHEAAYPLSIGLIKAKETGVEDAEYKLYSAFAKNQQLFSKAKDPKNALEVLNTVLDTKLTQKDLEDEKAIAKLESDMKMTQDAGVQGTPTIYVNGRIDKSRQKLQNLLK